jgi:hypothetical protein
VWSSARARIKGRSPSIFPTVGFCVPKRPWQPSPPPTPRNAPRARTRACQREVWQDPLISGHDGADRSPRCGHHLASGRRHAPPPPRAGVRRRRSTPSRRLPGATLMPGMRRAIHGRRSLLRSAAASRSHQGNTRSPWAARWSIGSVCFWRRVIVQLTMTASDRPRIQPCWPGEDQQP